MKPYKKSLKNPARRLRREMTIAEKALWKRIRRKQIHGVQFYRQKPLLNYIVDFYCDQAKLVIELDGDQHFYSEHQSKDILRDQAVSNLGIFVLRFTNYEVLKNTDKIVERIYEIVGERLKIPPSPPLQRGGQNLPLS